MSSRAKQGSARDADRERHAREALTRAEDSVRQAEERVEEATERAAESVERATDRAAEKVERATEQAARKVEQARLKVEEKAGEEGLIWLREEPAARRPSHSRAEIARAAIEIADAEGFDAVSMRRVAQKLGAGTMTLYHYVRNKDELVTLMSDAVMGEILVPDGELSGDWREALTQIATRTRTAFARHRWIFERFGDGRPGPNGMRHFEQSLTAVAALGLERGEVFDVIGQVDDFVFGYALRELQEREEHERGWPDEVVDFLQREIDSGDYPRMTAFFGTDVEAAIDEIIDLIGEEDRFARGLKRLLDGIEANLPPRT
ncbi:MAG TPA: TetR/AcrR family transcriptional regulator C-terminal domain-containing protein [Solirubrobacterales bacterium]